MKFGIDILGGASGFSANNPCSGVILNYNSDYMLIDCMPYLNYALNARGISINQIQSLFLTHIHDDHCNIFPLVLSHKKIKVLSTKEIFWMACKKLSLMTMHDIEEFYSYFEFVELKPYVEHDFYGIKIKPHYSVHSIPTIGATIQMYCNGHLRSVVFTGDSNSLSDIKRMADNGLVREDKYFELEKLYRNRYDMLVADGGLGALHGNPRDSLQSKSERVVFLHLEELPEEFNTTFTLAVQGKRFTIKEGNQNVYILKALHILNAHYKIAMAGTLMDFNIDEIVEEGDVYNNHFYVILSGKYFILKNNKVIATLGKGKMFGLYCNFDNNQFSATVKTLEPGNILVVEKERINPIVEETPCLGFHLKKIG